MMRGIAAPLEKHHRRADPRRSDRGGGAAVASLHPGAPAAGQGGQPARHRLRPRRGQPARRAAGGGGLPPPHRRRWRPSCEIIDREARGRHRHRRTATRRSPNCWRRTQEDLVGAGRALGRGEGAGRQDPRRCAAQLREGTAPVDAPARPRHDRAPHAGASCGGCRAELADASGRDRR